MFSPSLHQQIPLPPLKVLPLTSCFQSIFHKHLPGFSTPAALPKSLRTPLQEEQYSASLSLPVSVLLSFHIRPDDGILFCFHPVEEKHKSAQLLFRCMLFLCFLPQQLLSHLSKQYLYRKVECQILYKTDHNQMKIMVQFQSCQNSGIQHRFLPHILPSQDFRSNS